MQELLRRRGPIPALPWLTEVHLLGAAAVAAAVTLPLWLSNPYYIKKLTAIGILIIVTQGLNVLSGFTGQLSLGHAGLYAIGAYTTAILTTRHGWGMATAMMAAILLSGAVGAVFGFPALRTKGHYLAMVTIGFGIIVHRVITAWSSLTGGFIGIQLIPKFSLFGKALSVAGAYWFVLALVLLTLYLVHTLLHSRQGRALLAVRESETAAEAVGISLTGTKLAAFVLSAMLAGLGGSLFAHHFAYVSPDSFTIYESVMLVVAVIVGGMGRISGPIIGVIVLDLLGSWLQALRDYRLIVYGVMMLGFLVFQPGGLVEFFPERWRRRVPANLEADVDAVNEAVARARVAGTAAGAARAGRAAAAAGDGPQLEAGSPQPEAGAPLLEAGSPQPEAGAPLLEAGSPQPGAGAPRPETGAPQPETGAPRLETGAPLLEARGIIKRFGGLTALDGVSLRVMPHTIHGLIGPNGSGKSTLVNVISGFYRADGGDVRLAGRTLPAGPHRRAARGIARTFQHSQSFRALTALENVQAGQHHWRRTGWLSGALGLPWARREERQSQQFALGLLSFLGLTERAHYPAGGLPTGMQRLLEIARALAGKPRVLLLDEPAAGLTEPEIAELGKTLLRLRELGLTIVLIEHDLQLVMSVCDTVTVLDSGRVIASGPPAAVQADPLVQQAYLGEQQSAEAG